MSDDTDPPVGPGPEPDPNAAEPTLAMGAVPPPGDVPPATPPPTPAPWYHNRAALGAVIGVGLALLFLLIALIIWWAGDDDDDEVAVDETTTSVSIPVSTSTAPLVVDTTTSTTEAESTTTTSTSIPVSTSSSPLVVPTTTSTTTTTTTTTVPATTTTTTTTTIPVVTVPPGPDATMWDLIVNSPDLDELRALIELAGLDDELDDAAATYTLFAPSNTAIENARSGVGAPDFTDPAVVEQILRSHLHIGDALTAADVLALTEVTVDQGGPHAVDAAADPPTVGGAALLVTDVETANGVLHVIDTVLRP